MSTTSRKYCSFVGGPMGQKDVKQLGGIGNVLGNRLISAGYDHASEVYGKFLLMERNRELFIQWLHQTCGANSKQANDCYSCLNGYYNTYF